MIDVTHAGTTQVSEPVPLYEKGIEPCTGGFAGFEHPAPGLHVPGRWQLSFAVHVTADPTHVPLLWQTSFCVQTLPSSHVEPVLTAGVEQIPVPAAHVDAAWHASPTEHDDVPQQTPFTQNPVAHWPVPVHACPCGALDWQVPVATLQYGLAEAHSGSPTHVV